MKHTKEPTFLSLDAKRRRFLKSGHAWKADYGIIDIFAYSKRPSCNGPACTQCGYAACWHCNPEPPKCEMLARLAYDGGDVALDSSSSSA